MHQAATATFLHLGVLLALLIAAEVRTDPPPNEQSALQSPSETPAAATDATNDGEASAIAPTKPPSRRAHRVVFTCRDGVTPVFSDRPCGDEEHRHRLDVPSPAAGSAPGTRPAAAPAATRARPVRVPRRVSPDPTNACARLEEQLASIDARMRQGYSARESARLWQRWRDAKAKLRAARC